MIYQYLQAKSLKADAADYIVQKPQSDDDFIVTWREGDTRNPLNWSSRKKWWTMVVIALVAFSVSFAASINSAAAPYAQKKFHVKSEVMMLQDALFLIGFGLTAPFMGSLSELSGRNPVYIITLLMFSLFSMGSGFAKNIWTRAILRFFAGACGAPPLSNAGGSAADIANHIERSYFYPTFAALAFSATALGPVWGGWIGERTDESWCDWTSALAGTGTTLICILTLSETSGMQLLKYRSEELRRITGDNRYMTPLEKRFKESPHGFAYIALRAGLRPVRFLFTEPITAVFSVYMMVVYIVMFGDLECYPIVFSIYNWDTGKVGSVFAAMFIGIAFTGVLTPLTYWHYTKWAASREAKGLPVTAEGRLFPCMILTWTMPIALFWAGWTAYPSISPWSLIVSQFLFGIGALACFSCSNMYLIDVYQTNAASPLATMVFLRYIVAGGGSIPWTEPLFDHLGIHWAFTFLGCLAVLVSCIPALFYFIGPPLRRRSAYAASQ